MNTKLLLRPFLVFFLVIIAGCSSDSSNPDLNPPVKGRISATHYGLNIKTQLMIPEGLHGRHRRRKLDPKYITIHSTQNRSSSANAFMHAIALNKGRLKGSSNSLGYLTWHYTVDQSNVYQHLPENEQGQHADYEGLGNRRSLGIEMCENRGNSQALTIDQTAKLCAYLMRKHRIPLSRVVPHQHWPRYRYSDGKNLGYKNCPQTLLDGGVLGPKWEAFKMKVRYYLSL